MIINHWVVSPQNQTEVDYLKKKLSRNDIQIGDNYKISDEIYSDILHNKFDVNGLPVDAMIR